MKKRIAEGTTIELAKPGVNLTLLWTEYCSDCYASKLTPYMYTQFCDKYRKWARLTKATMRITHKPGDAMQVDWVGTTIPYYDRVTGEAADTYLFAAVLPCSCYAYVEACDDMKTINIIDQLRPWSKELPEQCRLKRSRKKCLKQ